MKPCISSDPISGQAEIQSPCESTELCPSTYNCPVEATVHLIGGKYKSVILWHLKDRILRYNELHKLVPNATPKMLTQQLRELEKDNLIGRTVYPVVPPKTEYYLTDFGKSVIPVLDAMCTWGTAYLKKKDSI